MKLTRVVRDWAAECAEAEEDSKGSKRTRRMALACDRTAAFNRMVAGGLAADVGLQAALVLIFPGLFIAAVRRVRAKREIKTLGDFFEAERFHYLDAEEQKPRFWRRLCFAVLLTVGVQYVLSPAGMIASAMGEFASLTAVPGESSMPFFVTYLSTSATPMICGFMGFYVYSLSDFWGRFSSGTANHLMFLSLFRRGVIVWLICLVLGSMVDSGVVNVIAFGLGCFPNMALSYVGKLVDGASGKLIAQSPEHLGFRALPELDLLKQGALEEVGIATLHDLAHSTWASVIQETGINGPLLLHAADQALLFDVLGVEAATQLSVLSIRTGSDLAAYLREGDKHRAAVCKALGAEDVSVLQARVEASPNVDWALELRARFEGTEGRAEPAPESAPPMTP